MPEPVKEQAGQSVAVKRLDAHKRAELAREAAQMAAPAYAAVGWAWGDSVPSEARIEKRLHELIRDVGLDRTLSTGGLHVSRWVEDDEEHVAISLEIGSTYR